MFDSYKFRIRFFSNHFPKTNIRKMPYNAPKIANEFLRLARASEPPRLLTPLQLIKLVYIAHGWSFVFTPDHPLLAETPLAWQYGPVVPSLYAQVKAYGAGPVEALLYDPTPKQEIDGKTKELVGAVFQAYAHYSGVQLSSMTHQPNTPWHAAWNKRGRNAVITNDAIREHYKSLAQARGAAL